MKEKEGFIPAFKARPIVVAGGGKGGKRISNQIKGTKERVTFSWPAEKSQSWRGEKKRNQKKGRAMSGICT